MAGAMAPDPLSDVLRTVRLTGALFFLWDVSWPYATPVPAGRAIAPIVLPSAQQIVSYHIITQGSCWGSLIGGTPVRLEAGDILLIPHGDAYVIASSAQLCAEAEIEIEPALGFFRQMAAGELPFVVAEGGGEDISTQLVCGFLDAICGRSTRRSRRCPRWFTCARRPTGPKTACNRWSSTRSPKHRSRAPEADVCWCAWPS